MGVWEPNLSIAPAVQDATDNTKAISLLGNKTDTASEAADTISLMRAMRAILAKANGGVVLTYPVLSAGVTVTAGAANVYTADPGTELAAAASITVDSRLASVCVRTPSAGFTGKINLGHETGGTTTWVCEVDVEVATDAGGYMMIPLIGMGGVLPSGSGIRAALKTTAGGTTADLSVGVMPAL